MRTALAALSLTLASLSVATFSSSSLAAEPVNVKMETSRGDILLALDADRAPVSVKNFVDYARAGHYDGTAFHRVIKGFMVQGGGYDSTPTGYVERPTRAPIVNEARNGLKNVRGSIAMARTGDPNSATSQFFINHANNDNLDYPSFDGYGYAVFGKVTQGMDVVDAIARAPTCPLPPFGQDVPCAPITIRKVTILSGASATATSAVPGVTTTTTVATQAGTAPAAATATGTATKAKTPGKRHHAH